MERQVPVFSEALSGHFWRLFMLMLYCDSAPSELKPGDLIFYGKGGSINHVAIYIGGGQIVHASNKRDGIKISNAFYRTPIKCVRVLYDW